MTEPSFYAIGLGPGDPDLLTRQALRCLDRSDRVYCPRSTRSRDSLSAELLRRLDGFEAPIVEYALHMHGATKELQQQYRQTAEEIVSRIQDRETISAVCLGDASVHSTLTSLLNAVKSLLPPDSIQVVPGISAFQAASSLLQQPLVQGEQHLAVVSARNLTPDVEDLLNSFQTVVFLKPRSRFPRVRTLIERHRPLDRAVLLEHIGTPNQQVTSMENVNSDRDPPYFSLILSYAGPPR